MTDPARLLDDGTDAFERAVLGSAQLDREPADGADRALAALGVSVAAGVALSASATPPVTVATSGSSLLAGAGLAVKAGVLAVVASGAVAAAVVASSLSSPTPAPARAPSPPVALVVAAPATTESARAPQLDVPPPVAIEDLPSAPVVSSPASAPRPRAAASATIGDELRLVDAARASLARGDTNAAEKTLQAYDARFADGALKLEAKLARIEMHLARSEDDRAAALCEQFLQEHPRTAFDRRVRALLARAQASKEK